MIFVVFGLVGWNAQAQQDQIYNALESGKVGKAQFTAGTNDRTSVANAPYGNHFRVEFTASTDADATWQQIKAYLATNTPVPGSRVRRLDCSWDATDPSLQACTVVEALTW
jgi:hypothetical protein